MNLTADMQIARLGDINKIQYTANFTSEIISA